MIEWCVRRVAARILRAVARSTARAVVGGCYSLDLMVVAALASHDRPMTSTTHDSTETAPQPGTAVFEHSAVLLASAQALEAAAREPGAETALGPMLACLDLSLDALAHAVEQLRGNALEPVARSATDREIRFAITEAAQQFGALVAVLADGRDACVLARSSVAPIQGELTAR
jgi:hypothetical protein